MKPHPRIRKTVKWGGAAVTLLLVGAWIWGGWWNILVPCGGGNNIALFEGSFVVDFTHQYGQAVGLVFDRNDAHEFLLAGAFSWDVGKTGPMVGVPLWSLLIVFALATVTAWILDTIARRRARSNLCPKCNYDRTGLAAGAVCPECGKLPA